MIALRGGNCAAWRAFQTSVKFRVIVSCDERRRARFAGFRITNVAQYGTGAVLTYVSAGNPKGYTTSYLLGPGRRWVYSWSLDPLKVATVFKGTASPAPFNRSLMLFLSAVRAGNCAQYWKYGVFASEVSDKQSFWCRRAFGPPKAAWVRDLQGQPGANPIAFGGNRNWHFYGLRTPTHYYSVAVGNYGPPPPPYLVNPPVRVF